MKIDITHVFVVSVCYGYIERIFDMKIYLTKQDGAIPVVYDLYWRGKRIAINAWVKLEVGVT